MKKQLFAYYGPFPGLMLRIRERLAEQQRETFDEELSEGIECITNKIEMIKITCGEGK
jgi:hypothetical protein